MKLKIMLILATFLMFFNGNECCAANNISNTVVDLTEVSTTDELTEEQESVGTETESTEAPIENDSTTSEEATEEITEEESSTEDSNNDDVTTKEELMTPDDLLPDVDEVSFFNHLFKKLGVTLSGFQAVIAIILIFLFILSAIAVVISCFGQKSKIPWYLLSMLICLLMFFAVIYAKQLMAIFLNWFKFE